MHQGYVLVMLVGMSLILFFTTQFLLDERSKHGEAVGRYDELRLALESERGTKKMLEVQLAKLQDALVSVVVVGQQRPASNVDNTALSSNTSMSPKKFADLFQSYWKGDPRPPMTTPFILHIQRQHPSRPYYPSRENLVEYFHYGDEPYQGIEIGDVSDFGGYVSYAERSADLIRNTVRQLLGGPPQFVIEVGSFVGSSIVHVWAPLVREHPKGILLSVDTWLGDLNMRVLPEFKRFLRPVNGIPTLAHRFMRRMVYTNNTQYVIPLPLPSIVAARALTFCEFLIDVIYVDSAHEKGETFAELVLYYALLRPGGLLCGDDYHGWPAVRHDVTLFSTSFNLKVRFLDGDRPANPHRPEGGQWCVQKES